MERRSSKLEAKHRTGWYVLTVVALLALLPVPCRVLAHAETRVAYYVRYLSERGMPSYGVLEDDTIYELRLSPFESTERTGRARPLSDTPLLAPVVPSKIIGVVANYQRPDRARVLPKLEELPRRLFSKLPSALSGPYDDIWLPPGAANLDWEGELVVVVGKRARDVSERDAMSHVFGLTVGNDVSENDWFRNQRLLGKAVDTWAPIGPWIVTGLDWNGLLVETRVNGALVQAQRTSEMIYPVPLLVSQVSKLITLQPGDLIFTGTVARSPKTPKSMRAGDVIEVKVEGIGAIRNRVVSERPVAKGEKK